MKDDYKKRKTSLKSYCVAKYTVGGERALINRTFDTTVHRIF